MKTIVWLCDWVEIIPQRRFQLIRRRAKEITRRRRQFGMYFGWFNLNSQMVVKHTRK